MIVDRRKDYNRRLHLYLSSLSVNDLVSFSDSFSIRVLNGNLIISKLKIKLKSPN